MEVLYDLDYEARRVCERLGLTMIRAATVGTHPLFVQMVRELIEERLSESPHRTAIGEFPAWPDQCPPDCCPSPSERSAAGSQSPPPLRKGGEGGVT
jgi:ferrochelatase